MTLPVLKNRLINFSGLNCESQQQINCHRQAYNSLIIKKAQLDNFQQVDDYTHCEKPQCRMVLTNQDRDYIDDWNWVSSNEEFYKQKGKEMQNKIETMRQNKYNYFIWNCRFCGNPNLVEKDKAYFAKNKSKVVIKDGSTGQKSNKVSESPLLLFLIDNSSSMEQQIGIKVKQDKQLSTFVNEVLKNTNIYKKISENQKKQLDKIKQSVDNPKIQAYEGHLSKYRVLMSMTQKVISQIHESKSSKFKVTPQNNKTRKIGFMFFNSDIILQKIPQQSVTTVIKVSNKINKEDRDKEGHLKVDFQKFDDLYELGRKNSINYGMEMSLFKFLDIQVNSIPPSGQTALGPALVIASGIVSGYGPGSLIIIVTDGKANKGIFDGQGPYQQQIALLRLKLNNSKAATCLIQLQMKSEQKKAEYQTTLQRYFRKYSSVININLSQKQPLKRLQIRLQQLIQKLIKSKNWANDIRIKCQNPNIKFSDNQLAKMKARLWKQKQIQTISPIIKQAQLTAFDYRHPFMTQILVEYQNIETKQSTKFMAYIIQKIIRFNEMNKKDEQSFNSSQTLQNVMNYLQVQGQKLDLNNIPLSLCQQSFRSSIMQSYKCSIQRQYEKQIMKDSMFETYANQNQRQNYKTTKQYIRSMTQKSYQEEEDNQLSERL